MKELADGGEDSIYNTAFIHPECHNEIHYGEKGKELNEKLISLIIVKQEKIDRFDQIDTEMKARSKLMKNLSKYIS